MLGMLRWGPVGAVLILLSSTGAAAQEIEPDREVDGRAEVQMTIDPHTALGDDPDQDIHWRWARFRTWQYVATPAMALTAGALRFFGPTPRHLDYPILFDEPVQDALYLEDHDARSTLRMLTDLTYYGSLAYAVADVMIVGLVYDSSWDVSWQMLMLDVQSFAMIGAVTFIAQSFVGRPRPSTIRCEEESPGNEAQCSEDGEALRSFVSGHFAIAVAGAGLTCLHHTQMPLYGGGAADYAACGVMIGLAALNGYGRLAVEKHYATDVALGLGLGLAAGVAVPYWLHYDQEIDLTIGGEEEGDARAMVVPTFHESGGGLEVRGQF
jgi:hypothetical protein